MTAFAHPATGTLLAGLKPRLNPGIYCFAHVYNNTDIDSDDCLCVMREADGVSLITTTENLPAGAVTSDYRAAWITLAVDSQLADIGLTAAVSQYLADAAISCNIVAGVRHDHLFVPADAADTAMALLEALQRDAQLEIERKDTSGLAS